MKKTFKRLGAMFLAMVMAVSVLCTGALADESYSITIRGKSTGHTYEAYQVFAGDVAMVKEATEDTKAEYSLSNIQWGSAIDGEKFLAALKADSELRSDFSNCTTAADVANVLSTKNDYKGHDAAKTQKFASIVGKNLKANATYTKFSMASSTGNDGVVLYSAFVPAGYYLIKDKDGSQNNKTGTAATRFILDVVGPQTVESKDSVPTVTKKVNGKKSATANIGDVVKFELTGTLPDNYDDYESYTYIFHDTLSKGLTYNNDVQVYTKYNGSEIELSTELYNIQSQTVENGTAITVAVNGLKNQSIIGNGNEIIVKYSATLNENAQVGSIGNENKVYLEYSNDPNAAGEGTTGKTPEDVVKVYTFQLNVDKVDANEHTGEESNITYTKHLPGAEFELYRDEKCTQKIKLVQVGEDGVYRVAKSDETDVGTIKTVGEKGTLSITGLKDGTYYLKETKAPDGYNLPTNNVTKVKIAATDPLDGTLYQNSCIGVTVIKTADNKPTGEATATITNTAASTLPSTGGMGTKLFYVIGGLLMAGAVIVLVIKKRRSSAE